MTNPTPTRAEVEALADRLEARWPTSLREETCALLRALAATLPPQAAPAAGALLPCPFCGAVEGVVYSEQTHPSCGIARCSNCNATHACNTEAEAIRRWNRRDANAIAAAAQKAALEAEARCAEMREAVSAFMEYVNNEAPNLDRATVLGRRVLSAPSPSPDRFMRLLEAMPHAAHHLEHGAAADRNGAVLYFDSEEKAINFINALAAFPQPEEQP